MLLKSIHQSLTHVRITNGTISKKYTEDNLIKFIALIR